jgi:hypothetical protein
MPYYASGDYYGQGDYYRGDGIFSSIGRGLKVVVGAGLGYLTGGPKGAITGAVGATAGAVKSGIMQETLAAGSMPAEDAARVAAINAEHARLAMMPPMIAPPMIPSMSMAYGMPMGGVSLVSLGAGAGVMVPRGYRPNKSTYAVRGGGTSRWGAAGMVRIIPKGTVAVKSRRMNVANPKALRRGLRRAAGFVKLARRAHVKLAAFTGRGKAKARKR